MSLSCFSGKTAKNVDSELKRMNYRFADPEYVNFVPKDAMEAILKFRRLQKQGLDPSRYPEAFIECAMALSDKEVSKFEEWIVCPQGEPGKECIDVSHFSEANERTHNEIAAQQSRLFADEKTQEV